MALALFGALPAEAQEQLVRENLLRDLQTSANAEILDWATSLGVSTRGSRQEIENRILQYYGVSRSDFPGGQIEQTGDSSLIVIESASRSEVFTIESVDEDYLTVRGGVVIRMEDGDRIHRIEAESVTFNITSNSLAADGGVVYTVTGPSGTEEFSGNSIFFQLDTWEGVFLAGVTQTAGGTGESTTSFSVAGNRISRSANEVIVIEKGEITSSAGVPPNFSIRARKIWILSPGEWGLKHATLRVGHVPMLYIPYFFLPGDKIILHPVAGNRPREGSFIQTTTFFAGQAEDTKPPLSIMQLADTAGNAKRVRHGLFLRIPETPAPPDPDGWSIKLLADYYTTLGGYAAIVGTQPGYLFFDDLDYRLGIARSRTVFYENGVYSSYYVSDEGTAQRSPDAGYFFGTSLPFRYEAQVSNSLSLSPVTIRSEFTLLSDPAFRRDFYDRDESFDWGLLLSSGGGSVSDAGAQTISSLRWQINASWKPDIKRFSPWLRSFSVNRFRSDLNWATATVPLARLPEIIQDNNADSYPNETFFYPQNAVLPDISLSFQGTLFSWPSPTPETPMRTDSTEEVLHAIEDLRPPWTEYEPDTPDAEDFRTTDLLADLPGIADADTARVSLTYTVDPSIRADYVTDNDEWESPEEIDWNWLYGTREDRIRAGLSLTTSLPDSIVSTSTSLTMEYRHQQLFTDSGLEETARQALDLAGYRFDSTVVNQTSTVSVKPFGNERLFGRSSATYTLGNALYERDYDESTGQMRFVRSWVQWNDEYIQSHRVGIDFVAASSIGDQSFTTTAVLPPLDPQYSGTFKSVTGPVTSQITAGIRRTNDEWVRDPLQQSHTLSLFDRRVSADQQLQYDMEDPRLTRSSTTLRIGPLSTTLLGQESVGYSFLPAQGWVSDGNEKLRFTTYKASLKIDSDERYFWKNRAQVNFFANTDVDFAIQRFTNSSLSVRYGLSFQIDRFLDFEVSARSRNDFIYQYFPALASEVDREPRPFIGDILDSITLWNRANREQTFFKLQSIELSAIHDLSDWELRVNYSGGPELDTIDAVSSYRWSGVLTVLVRWKSIEELRRNIEYSDDTVNFID